MEGQLCEEHGQRLASLETVARDEAANAAKLDHLVGAVDKLVATQDAHGELLDVLVRDKQARDERARVAKKVVWGAAGAVALAFLSACGAWIWGAVTKG